MPSSSYKATVFSINLQIW
jgi:hypothetical protein